MVRTWFIDGEITKHRSTRVGASEIACLLPNPEKPNESLDGYRTAVDLFNEKTGRKKPEPVGLPAEMGHLLEPAAVEMFMRELFGVETSTEWFIRRMQYEILLRKARLTGTGWPRAETYQVPPIQHSVEYYTDQFIVHSDGIYRPNGALAMRPAHGLTFDLSRPFLVEAKSARYFSARRPEGSMVSGYDLTLRTWQGIPLKHYVQIQFQLALLEVDVCYLPLLFDTSEFQVWEIKEDRAVQNKLIDLAGKMAWHIQNDIPPKELAMNGADIQALYPTVSQDFTYVSGDEAEAIRTACSLYGKAAKQEVIWKGRKREALDTLAVHLRERKELRDADDVLARWTERTGGEDVKALSKIKADDPTAYKYLKRKGLLVETKPVRYASAVWKGDTE